MPWAALRRCTYGRSRSRSDDAAGWCGHHFRHDPPHPRDRGVGAATMPVIEIDGLAKRFGDLIAVDPVTFTVEQGSVVRFLGGNGAGKTTTLRMLPGLIAASEGTQETTAVCSGSRSAMVVVVAGRVRSVA